MWTSVQSPRTLSPPCMSSSTGERSSCCLRSLMTTLSLSGRSDIVAHIFKMHDSIWKVQFYSKITGSTDFEEIARWFYLSQAKSNMMSGNMTAIYCSFELTPKLPLQCWLFMTSIDYSVSPKQIWFSCLMKQLQNLFWITFSNLCKPHEKLTKYWQNAN